MKYLTLTLSSVLFCLSCSPYRNVIVPLHDSPAYIEWYFGERTKTIRDSIEKNNPKCNRVTLDSLTFIAVGEIMLEISIEDFAKIKKAYDSQHYNVFVNE